MSFGANLSKEFQKLTGNIFYSEVQLFTKLQDAFINTKANYCYDCAIDIVHGNKSMVDFTYDSSYVSSFTNGDTVRRELADILFIAFGQNNGNQIRLAYLQNKKGTDWDEFYADLLQLHLLKDRRPITSSPLPACAFGNSRILADAILPSVGAYGIFYQDKKNKKVDMAYYPASNISLHNTSGTSRVRKVEYASRKVNRIEYINGYAESQGKKNLEEFANSLINLEIGTPIIPGDDAFYQIVAFLIKYSPSFRESRFIQNLQIDFIDNKSLDLQIILGKSCFYF